MPDSVDQIRAAWRNGPGDWEFDEFALPWISGIETRSISGLSNAEFLPDGTVVIALQEKNWITSQVDLYFLWRYPDGTWVRELIDDEGLVNGFDPHLAVDASGNPAIVYRYVTDDNSMHVGEYRYAAYDGSGWTIEVTDLDEASDGGVKDFLFVGDTAYAVLASKSLGVAERQGTHWEFELVDTAGGVFELFTGAKIASYGERLYLAADEFKPFKIFYYTEGDGYWEKEPVFGDDTFTGGVPGFLVGEATYIAFNNENKAVFAYQDETGWTTEVAFYDVSKEPLLSGKNCLALTADGRVVLSFKESYDDAVWFGVRESLP